MYTLYSGLLFLVFLVYFPVYWLRSRVIKREPLHLKERLGRGLVQKEREGKSLWIHAVSVGEVLSLRKIIAEIKNRHPEWMIHFSVLTHSGYQIAQKKLSPADHIFFVPLDFDVIVRNFFKKIKPDLFVIAESEFWPNLLRRAKEQTKGVLLINGRISTRTRKRFSVFSYFVQRILQNISFFLVQTERDKRSLVKTGINADRIAVGGNLKADVDLPIFSSDALSNLKINLGIRESHKVVVAGSTHKGEEEKLLLAFVKAKEARPNIQLILAPRHVERGAEIEKLCAKSGIQSVRRTKVHSGEQWDILILDTLGELVQFYALSDASFVGGSLVPWGGQNLLEPAFYGKPIFFGPHMDNFSYLSRYFLEKNAARIVSAQGDLVKMFVFEDEKALEQMGRQARETLDTLSGATEKTLAVIEDFMDR